MSFLKTDGLVFEDEEVDDEIINSEEETDELEDDVPGSDGEEPEDENDEEEEQNLYERIRNLQEKFQLKRIKKRVLASEGKINAVDMALLQRLRKRHPKEVREIEGIITSKEFIYKVKTTGKGAAGGAGLWWIILIILAILVVLAFASLLGASPEESTKSEAGIKGNNFYGARIVYRDDELARNGLVEQYVNLIKSTAEPFKDGKVYDDIDVGGTTYDIKVAIDLTIPAEDFNYEELDLTTFASEYSDLYSAVEEITRFVYDKDNESAETQSEEVASLETYLDGIKYFGFNAGMIGSNIVDEDQVVDNNILEIVYDLLKSKINVMGKTEGGSNYETPLDYENVKDNFVADIVNLMNADVNRIRAEKLFIKDIILDGEDSFIEGIDLKDYEAFIYLPKQTIKCNFMSYMFVVSENSDINVKLINNDQEIQLNKGDAEYPYDDKSFVCYKFDSSKNLNVTINPTDCIDTSNLNQFTNATSLVKVLQDKEIDYESYLEKTTLENGDVVLTYKKGSTYLLFETDAEFKFTNEVG